jgi:hypothetical protein
VLELTLGDLGACVICDVLFVELSGFEMLVDPSCDVVWIVELFTGFWVDVSVVFRVVVLLTVLGVAGSDALKVVV